MNDLPSSLISLSTFTSPGILFYLLAPWVATVLVFIWLLIKSTNTTLSATDRDQAERSKLIVELLIRALVLMFGRGGKR